MPKHYNITGTMHDRADRMTDLLDEIANELEALEADPDDPGTVVDMQSVVVYAAEKIRDIREAMERLKNDISEADDDVRDIIKIAEALKEKLY